MFAKLVGQISAVESRAPVSLAIQLNGNFSQDKLTFG